MPWATWCTTTMGQPSSLAVATIPFAELEHDTSQVVLCDFGPQLVDEEQFTIRQLTFEKE